MRKKPTYTAEALPLFYSSAQIKLVYRNWAEALELWSQRVYSLLQSDAPAAEKLREASDFKQSVDNFHRFEKTNKTILLED